MTTAEMEKMIEYHDKRVKEIWELFAATDRERKNLDEQLNAQFKATDEKIKEVTALVGNLVNKWGQFVEYILVPGIPRIFQARGIPIHTTGQRMKRELNGENMEIDILGLNDDYALVVEVKSTLSKDDVEDTLDELSKFKKFFPEYANRKVLGAVAGIVMPKEATRLAYRKGLFVLGQSGESVAILNDEKFKPKTW